jgi:hypothetical protein
MRPRIGSAQRGPLRVPARQYQRRLTTHGQTRRRATVPLPLARPGAAIRSPSPARVRYEVLAMRYGRLRSFAAVVPERALSAAWA